MSENYAEQLVKGGPLFMSLLPRCRSRRALGETPGQQVMVMQVGGCYAGRWAGLWAGVARPGEEQTGFQRQVMPHEWQVEVRKAKAGAGRPEETSPTKGQRYHLVRKAILST